MKPPDERIMRLRYRGRMSLSEGGARNTKLLAIMQWDEDNCCTLFYTRAEARKLWLSIGKWLKDNKKGAKQ